MIENINLLSTSQNNRSKVTKVAIDGVRVWALATALTLSKSQEVCLEPWQIITGCQVRLNLFTFIFELFVIAAML